MFYTLIFCVIMSLFALGCIFKPTENARRGDAFNTWLVMFASCCIIAFPIHWAFITLF